MQLADHVVSFDDVLLVFQFKERGEPPYAARDEPQRVRGAGAGGLGVGEMAPAKPRDVLPAVTRGHDVVARIMKLDVALMGA